MKSIYKYPLEIADEQKVKFHGEPQILSVQFQGSQLCLWALVDPDSDIVVNKLIEVHGTGNPFPTTGNRRFIGTAQDGRSPSVWHIFEQL